MYKSIFGLLLLFTLMLTGCTNEEDAKLAELEKKYKTQIEELKKENEHLKDEYNKQLGDYSVYLQIADRTSRQIMRLISEGKFDELKSEHGIELTISDGNVYFDDNSAGLPIEQASFHMTIEDFIVNNDSFGIGYFIEDLDADPQYVQSYSIGFDFDKNGKFLSFFNGDA